MSGRSRTYVPAMMAALGAGATVGFILPMSRAQESEADRIGLVLMALAGYDPREAIVVWERMHAASTGRRQAEWLSTHPADTTRLADIRQWLPEAMKYYRPGMNIRDRLEYDATGLLCPLPVLRANRKLRELPVGGLLTVRATDPAAEQDFPAYCRQTGHELVSSAREGEVLVFVIRKR